jgi:hypothetical protein
MEQTRRSPDSVVPATQRAVLWKLFGEVDDLHLGYSLPAVHSDNPDAVRPDREQNWTTLYSRLMQ